MKEESTLRLSEHCEFQSNLETGQRTDGAETGNSLSKIYGTAAQLLRMVLNHIKDNINQFID